MHELALADSIVRSLHDAKEREGFGRLHSVRVEIGRLQLVVPEALDQAFRALTCDGPFAGAVLDQVVLPARARCHTCGTAFNREELLDACPDCGGYNLEQLTGFEMRIASLEVTPAIAVGDTPA